MKYLSEPSSGASKATILLVANVIVGGIVPFLISWFTKVSFSTAQSTLIALNTTLALTAAELLFKIEQLYELRRGEVELWAMRASIDERLSKIRAALHALVADVALRDSFFLDHYTRELSILDSRIQNTIVRKEILLDRHHIESTKVLLSIYENNRHDSFRATAILSDIADEFDVTFSIYFNAWLEMLREKKVISLKRLFIYKDLSEFSRGNARKLVAFHNGKLQGLEAKAVSEQEFHRFKEDFHITDGSDDIGIFSDMYIYLGRTRRKSDISGSFSRDQSLIDDYKSFFDALWLSRAAIPISQFVTDVVSEEQLFDRSFQLTAGSAQT